MKVDRELILKVANNSRISLNEEEIEEFISQFKDILDSFAKLDKVNTENVRPSFHPIDIKNILREDNIENCLTQEEALSTAKHKKDGYFKGPKVI
ncbi:Asp-tRNA(Asn)/Glu-tRNA(Gln) amidotransferase subunit GatC [Candidatus Woesearchaeota archaeon]|nr:Asp-tRNA(Asn)/Glu-tRNA(Gln) amidotransferase subunit GatC [Candidatus Woesearchaeota archaeon]